MTSSPYAAGFQSLHDETRHDSLPVDGKVPEWLSGRLIRTGPAKFEVGDESYNHWFDGLAMLHRFGFDDGRVSYANRFLEGDSYRDACERDGIARSEFATDPCRSIFGRVMSLFTDTTGDNANVNTGRIGERFVAMTETPMQVQFDPDTLETIGHLESPTDIPADTTTAHPHFDSRTQRALNYVLTFGRNSTYRIVATDPDSLERDVVATIDGIDRPSYIHSFGMTENYVVLAAFPFVVDPLSLLTKSEPFIRHFEWQPERGTRFWVVRKSDGDIVARHRADARFAFHHVNAYEDGDEIVADLATYSDPSIIDDLYLDRLRGTDDVEAVGRLERIRLRDGDREAEFRRLSDQPIELPRIHYDRVAGRPYEYVWGGGQHEPGNFIDQIVRIEVDTGESRCWREPGCYPGEPVFVPRPDPETEDDGVLLSVVLDADAESSFLLVLDAADLHEIARARVPHPIPFQLHGNYFASAPDS